MSQQSERDVTERAAQKRVVQIRGGTQLHYLDLDLFGAPNLCICI